MINEARSLFFFITSCLVLTIAIGILQGLQEDIVECFDLHDNSSIPGKHGKFPAYPFTPPESDASGSRPLSPETLLIEAQLSVVTLHPPALPPTGSLHGTSKTTRASK
jgi:hypothetical protein